MSNDIDCIKMDIIRNHKLAIAIGVFIMLTVCIILVIYLLSDNSTSIKPTQPIQVTPQPTTPIGTVFVPLTPDAIVTPSVPVPVAPTGAAFCSGGFYCDGTRIPDGIMVEGTTHCGRGTGTGDLYKCVRNGMGVLGWVMGAKCPSTDAHACRV